jgi:hypothetical protein
VLRNTGCACAGYSMRMHARRCYSSSLSCWLLSLTIVAKQPSNTQTCDDWLQFMFAQLIPTVNLFLLQGARAKSLLFTCAWL